MDDAAIERIFEDLDDEPEDVELLGGVAAQVVKVAGATDAKRKKSTVINKPSGTDDTGGKKKRVLPKSAGGADERKKQKI